MIQIKNLTKIYDSKKADKTVALSDLSFSLPSKGMVFIIGKSGSGKSTLLNILACLDAATKGSIKFNNLELTKLNSNKLNDFRAHEIGFIFQHYYLLNDLTVKENILLSNDNITSLFILGKNISNPSSNCQLINDDVTSILEYSFL